MTDFTYSMEIDMNGIVVVRIQGAFDYDTWLAKRRSILSSDLAGATLRARPGIIDISQADPPLAGWGTVFPNIAQELAKTGEGLAPTVFVIGISPARSTIVQFYREVVGLMDSNKIIEPTGNNYPTFETFDEAYSWLIENDSWRDQLPD